jgi:hypothetical protein
VDLRSTLFDSAKLRIVGWRADGGIRVRLTSRLTSNLATVVGLDYAISGNGA